MRSHLESCVQLWSPQHIWVGSTKMIRGMELLFYKAESGGFSLEKRRLQGDLIATFQYLKGAY